MQALRECVACINTKNENMAEGGDSSTQDISPPTKRTKSEDWAYFGLLNNAEGNYSVCRTFRKNVVRRIPDARILFLCFIYNFVI